MSNSGKRQIHRLPLLFTAIGLTLLYQVFVFRTLGQFSL